MSEETSLESAKIKSVSEIFSIDSLTIPEYQRPYKWQQKNVKQLLDDIILNNELIDYRLGTIVIHQDENGEKKIVDGQQRMLTLSLIAIALHETFAKEDFFKNYLTVHSPLLANEFTNTITQKNLQNNYRFIQREIHRFNAKTVHFFFNYCKVVWVTISKISEAFQFFDSQNARGKDLYPQDLLKAFHLREMEKNTEEERIQCVEYWENIPQKELNNLFNEYLFRIRNWSKGRSAEYFTKNDIDIFKGISLENPEEYNFIKPYIMNHYYTEMYNNETHRKVDNQKMEFPFQLDQVMINGKRFFEFITHYGKQVENIKNFSTELNAIKVHIKDTKTKALEILNILENYPQRTRTGDKYVRNVFNCCMLYYIDKFGYYKIDEAIVQFFVWAYTSRIEKHSVRLRTIDNLGVGNDSFFRLIRESINTKPIFHKVLKIARPYEVKDEPIRKMFNELNYLQQNAHE